MDWLRSEDLKEQKNETAPTTIIAVYTLGRNQLHSLTLLKEGSSVKPVYMPSRSAAPNSTVSSALPTLRPG